MPPSSCLPAQPMLWLSPCSCCGAAPLPAVLSCRHSRAGAKPLPGVPYQGLQLVGAGSSAPSAEAVLEVSSPARSQQSHLQLWGPKLLVAAGAGFDFSWAEGLGQAECPRTFGEGFPSSLSIWLEQSCLLHCFGFSPLPVSGKAAPCRSPWAETMPRIGTPGQEEHRWGSAQARGHTDGVCTFLSKPPDLQVYLQGLPLPAPAPSSALPLPAQGGPGPSLSCCCLPAAACQVWQRPGRAGAAFPSPPFYPVP